ncbi:MAG: ribosome maturation factor RimP [Nitrospiraceae bacterium]|nr:MAG: ribosome maturation factor RimP [Nitrospiraceae bacterium]
MSLSDLIVKVTDLIEPVIESLGIELDELEFKRMKGKALLRVFIDRKGGVTIDDCERVSREIEAVLDVEDPIPYSYVLEVSSPGLDRPLRKPEDFRKYSGSRARVITIDPIEKQNFFVGQIVEAGDSDIRILLQKDRTITIPYENISKARLEVEV